MDRRMLLAIVLSMLVVVIFQNFFFPQRDPVDGGAETGRVLESPDGTPVPAQSNLEPADPDRRDLGDSGALDTGTPATSSGDWDRAGAEEEITVSTEAYRAVFTNRGGKVKSWKLLGFNNPVGEPVELVLGRAELGLTLVDDPWNSPLDDALYEVRQETTSEGDQRLTFTAGTGARQVVKRFTLPREGYLARLEVQLRGFEDASGYRVTWSGGIPRAEASPKQYDMSAGTIVLVGTNKQTLKPGKFKNERRRDIEGNVRWAGVRNKYFAAILVPPAETSSLVVATGDNDLKITGLELAMPLLGGTARHGYDLWMGPLDFGLLKEAGSDLQKAVDLGWKIFRWLSKILLACMVWLHQFIPNFGWVIIIISAVTKVLFYPLTRTSIRSMKAMQQLQPEMTRIREKFKDDNQRLQKEMMEMYKKHKVNPIGGCLPMLLQMPVFIALYQVLNNDIAVRNAPFMLWITDLSSPDTLLTIGGFGIHILPIVLFGFTLLQQLLTPTSADPRQKMIGYMMPLITLFIFYGFPAGLNLYWTVNSILTVAQTWMIHREPMPTAAPA